MTTGIIIIYLHSNLVPLNEMTILMISQIGIRLFRKHDVRSCYDLSTTFRLQKR